MQNKFFKKIKHLYLSSQFELIIFVILILFHLPWVNYNGIAAGDTESYFDISTNWFNSDYIYFRPIIYPIFIFVSKMFGSGTYGILVLIQILFYAISGVLFYKLILQEANIISKKWIALLVVVSFSVPQSLYTNQYILPEMLPLFFILLFFNVLLKPPSLKNSLVLSLLLVIPILMKPLWLLLFAFPILKFVYSDKKIINFLYSLLIPMCLSAVLYASHQYLVAKENKNAIAASTFDVNTNLALIRMGFIDGSEGTKLYNYLNNKDLIYLIEQRKWENNAQEYMEFRHIKNQVPWEYREDSNFWRSIFLNKPENFITYMSVQLSRMPTFFSTSGENGKVVFLPGVLNSIYQKFFFVIHSSYLVFVLFIVFAFKNGLFNFKELTFHKILFFLIFFLGIVLCLLTYQDSHFIRMRAMIEPLLIYVALYTVITILTNLRVYFYPRIQSQKDL